MIITSAAYKTAIDSTSRMFDCKLVLNGQTYTKKDIVSFTLEEGLGGDKQLPLGGGYIASLTLKIKRIVEGLQEMLPSTLEISVKKDDGSYEPVKLGSFFAVGIKLDRNSIYTEIKLENEFCRLSDNYESTLQMPTSARAILQEIVLATGIHTVDGLTIIDDVINTIPKKCSYREAIVYIAQLNGAFAIFNREGKLDFIKLRQSGKHITKDMYKPSGLVRGEILYRFRGIENKLEEEKKVITAGSIDGTELKLTNPWMTQSILDRVYNQCRDLNYYPYTLEWRGDPALEVGDWITAVWGENIEIDVPIVSQTLTFDGGLSSHCSAEGKTQSQSSYQYKSPLQRKIEYIEELATSQGLMFMDTEAPKNPKDGDIWFKPAGGYVELWEHQGGKWVKKADTADVKQIVNKISTDEVLTKKISTAIANVIELNAKHITAGDIDMQRIRIVDGGKEVLAVRDGKLVINFGKALTDSIDQELKKAVKTGARNLYIEKATTRGVLNEDGSLSPSAEANTMVSDFIEVKGTTAIQQWIPKPGQVQQFNHWLKIAVYDKNKEFLRFENLQDGTDNVAVQTSNLFEAKENDAYIKTYSTYIEGTKTKVERGTLYTDWTPAPEDVEGQIINNRETIIKQINSQLLQLQTTAEGLIAEAIKSRVSNTDFGNFREEVQSKLQIQADNLTLTYNEIQSGLEAIGGYMSNQQLWLRTSVKGLEIGKVDSEVTTLYTNDALKFMYKGQVVAQFTNDFLEVRNVAVSGQMRYGSQWATRLGSEIKNKQGKVIGNTLNDVWIGG